MNQEEEKQIIEKALYYIINIPNSMKKQAIADRRRFINYRMYGEYIIKLCSEAHEKALKQVRLNRDSELKTVKEAHQKEIETWEKQHKRDKKAISTKLRDFEQREKQMTESIDKLIKEFDKEAESVRDDQTEYACIHWCLDKLKELRQTLKGGKA